LIATCADTASAAGFTTRSKRACGRKGVLAMDACIAVTATPDEHLTNASQRFHKRRGYRLCATFPQCGYKFGRWYDMIWMERAIGEAHA
jgi:phosphinothricin acetyltransferase